MTQAFNLALLANAVDTSGKLNVGTNATGTLPVANGGSGAATLAANNVLLGNGTSALQTVAPGTNGNVLTSNGTTWVSQAAAGGGSVQYSLALRTSAVNSSGTPLVYNSPGSLTWTAPSGVTRVAVTVYGGGGAGGAGVESGCAWVGGNGGTGGYAKGIYTVTPGTAYSITVGVGGTANGGSGGSSSFSTLISATGGAGGSNASAGLNGITGTSGIGSNGNFRNYRSNSIDIFFGGGQSAGSTSAVVWAPSNTGNNGAGGSGGGGTGNQNGGGGYSGIVLIEYVG